MTDKTFNDYVDIIRHHQKSWPIEMVPLANDIGLKVYKTKEWSREGGISGAIMKDKELGGNSGYACFINENHPVTRRRFTIAHELAHLILHKDLIGDGITDDALLRSGLSNKVEAEANRFAADILMPWDLINRAIAEGDETLPALAKAFNVSENAMSIRLGVPYEA